MIQPIYYSEEDTSTICSSTTVNTEFQDVEINMYQPNENTEQIFNRNQNIFTELICHLFILSAFPIPFLDLYYAYNNILCNYNIQTINISIQSYLLISGYISIGVIIFVLGVIILMCHKNIYSILINSYFTCVLWTVIFLIYSFIILWNLICVFTLLELSYVKNNNCSNNMIVYVITTIIIKFCVSFFEIIHLCK